MGDHSSIIAGPLEREEWDQIGRGRARSDIRIILEAMRPGTGLKLNTSSLREANRILYAARVSTRYSPDRRWEVKRIAGDQRVAVWCAPKEPADD